MDYPDELTHISLCAGYGGIDLGLRRALGTVRTVAFSEIEAFAAENLVAKVEAGLLDPAPIWTDLKTFPWEQFRGRVDILSGGFPCQPFSAAGRRAGDDDPRHLWPHITAGIRSLGYPPIVFFENVEGIISSKLKGDGWVDPAGTPVLLHVLRELERLGYEATAGVFSASEIGAPHQRKRVFIMGCRSDLSEAGRGVVDRLLRETRRGSDVGHTESCSCWNDRANGREADGKEHSPDYTGLPGPNDSERGQDVGNGSRRSVQCPCGRGRPKQKSSHDENRESSTSHAWPTARGAEELAHPESPRGERERRAVGQETAKAKRKNDGAKLNSSRSTAYPAPRGAEQYPWEPPRVTVGDTDLTGVEKRGASEPCINEEGREAQARHPRSSSTRSRSELDYTNSQGCLRDHDEQPSRGQGGREDANGHNAKADSPPRGVQGQTEPSLGGDADGVASGMGYAELCHAVDNRTDELRLLGNGVVPATAERAFRVLWSDLRSGAQWPR